jgi:hypothetical protein
MNQYSYIDHFCVCKNNVKYVKEYKVLDLGSNMSDHCPISLTLECISCHINGKELLPASVNTNRCQHIDSLPKLFWSPDVKSRFTAAADHTLAIVDVPDCCYQCVHKCSDSRHRADLNVFCVSIVDALTSATCACLSKKSTRRNKALWTDELSRLKSLSIQSHRAWVNAGRPRDGLSANNRTAAKLAYKQPSE